MPLRDFLDLDNKAPPPGPKRYVRRVGAEEEFTFLCYSATFWGCWTHWDGHHTQPHFICRDLCMGCKKGWPKRWKGYLDVYNAESKQREFLEVPPGVAEQFESQLPQGETFRGQRFTIKRGRGMKARCRVQFLSHITAIKPGHILPQAEDPRDILMSLWGLIDVAGELGDFETPPQNQDVG